MKGKFIFDGFENRLELVPENDYERNQFEEFLTLKPVGTKYVLRITRPEDKDFDPKKLVIKKKQFITPNFLKSKGAKMLYKRTGGIILYSLKDFLIAGKGTFLYAKNRTINIATITDFRIIKGGRIEIFYKGNNVIVLQGNLINTVEDFHKFIK